jgi:hypothetical protein
MDPGIPAHELLQWRSRLCRDFVLTIDQAPVHTIGDELQAISKARQPNKITVDVALTKDDVPNYLSAVGLPPLYLVQLRVMKRHISHAALAVTHKAVTGPKFNRPAPPTTTQL